MGSADGQLHRTPDTLLASVRWLQSRPLRDKTVLGLFTSFFALFLLWWSVEDHDVLFLLSEAVHIGGIAILAYKMYSMRSVTGISLQSQLLTAIFLLGRLLCSFLMEYDVHTILDALTLAGTGIIVFGFTFLPSIRATYQRNADRLKFYYVLIPCVLLAVFCHPPSTGHWKFLRVLWAFCLYLEAVSVLPQLRMLQRSASVERFTAHYVFAMGVQRFLNCAHWLLQAIDGSNILMEALDNDIWSLMVLLSEVVQTTILAGFCYRYVKSYTKGDGVVRLPTLKV